MFSRSSVLRHFFRHASTKNDKIPVQLLKDIEFLGQAGEIVNVKPAFMRNFLHVGNKACYMTNGPRIPVVERKRELVVEKKKKPVEKVPAQELEKTPESAPALSLDELSSLFSNMRKSKKTSTTEFLASVSDSVAYSLVELGESLPETFTLSGQKFPVSSETLAQTVFNSTGIEVPASVIKVAEEDGKVVEEISKAGIYSWSFLAPGDATILKRKLRIQ